MAYPWDRRTWGRDLAAAQRTFSNLVRTISTYEPVCLLAPPESAKSIGHRFGSSEVEIIPAEYDDIWVRDTLPMFAVGSNNSLVAIDWHFDGWGKSQGVHYSEDMTVGRAIARIVGATVIDTDVSADVSAEGGAFAFDGHDLIVATKSVMLHSKRNGMLDQDHLHKALLRASQCSSVCWLPGDEDEPITRGHADGILAFAEPDIVLFHWIEEEQCVERKVCESNLRAFQHWAQRTKRRYEIVKLPSLARRNNHYCASYVNFAHVNGAVVVPRHGGQSSKLDDRAKRIIQDAFGKRAIPVSINIIAAYGGGIHCATQQEPTTID
jgi:agmatine deiminase